MPGKIPSFKPKGKRAGGNSEKISEVLQEGMAAFTQEGNFAESALGQIEKALGKQQQREQKSFNDMFAQQQKSTQQFSSPIFQQPSQNFSFSGQDTSAMDTAAEKQQEAMEKQQQQEEEIAEETAEINEATREKVEKLKAERDAKIEKIRSGSAPFPLNIYMSNFTLIVMGFVDFALGWIPIPILGPLISFGISAVFWLIPCIIMFELFAYIKILGFLFANFIISIIPVAGKFATLAPEIIGLAFGPPAQLRKAWEEKMPAKIQRIRQDYDHRIAIAQAQGKDKLKKRLARIKGHFSGLAIENQKLVFLLAFIGIIVLGPFGIGAFSETNILSSIPVVIIIAALLLLGTKLGVLEQKEMFGLLLFLVLNVVLSAMLKASDFLSQYFKGNTVIVMILFFAFSLLFVLKSMDVISSRTIAVVMLILFLILSSFYMVGYLGSERFSANLEKSQAEKEVAWENANLLEKIELWIVEQKLRGSGEYIPGGQTEQTYTFMGVRMEDPLPFKQIFYSTEQVQVDIDYKANSYEPILISTSCKIGTLLGRIEPTYPVQATASYFPRVSCLFDSLPVGFHTVDVKGVYNYRSTVRLPVKIISTKLERLLLLHEKDAGETLRLQEILSKDVVALTSAGPIQIAVSNTREMGQSLLKMPMAMNEEEVSTQAEKRTHRLRFQMQLSNDETTGLQKIERIRKAQFNLPEGLALSNCNFAPKTDLQPLTQQGRWIYEVVDDFDAWTMFETLECDIHVKPEYVSTFFPEGVDWSKSTVLLTLDYDFSIQKSAVVQVEA